MATLLMYVKTGFTTPFAVIELKISSFAVRMQFYQAGRWEEVCTYNGWKLDWQAQNRGTSSNALHDGDSERSRMRKIVIGICRFKN